ncbi:MAG: [citrate (pro-3S)-lyase] ligase [Desulfuromonas sp.]|nr:MAG: [citrate (pro-3S)-lyase] ligase [Desulfuromonas sp.]
MVREVVGTQQRSQVKQFLSLFDLTFEDDCDDLLGIWDEQGRLIASGARQRELLKMIAVDPDHQQTEAFAQLVSELIRRGFNDGLETFFVVTRPQNSLSFEAVNFRLLCLTEQTALLEYGPGIAAYVDNHRPVRHDGVNGAVVINANPFTLGHRYLIETAARQVDWLYVFVVQEDSSSFTFDVRYDLVCQGVTGVDNVTVLPTGPYAISAMTFPGYFLKDHDAVEAQQLEMDATLFARQLAPRFAIRRRFVGSEPYCDLTRRYNEALKKYLPRLGVDLIEIPRATNGCDAISASQVRELLGDRSRATLEALVPSSTLNYLLSSTFNTNGLAPGRH